ncbi:MAG: nuclear transport factor 2 family protein [Roseiarcus sp.]
MADGPPSEIKALIDAHVDAFNSHNVELFLSVFADDAIIIDGVAPYRWVSPNAAINWLADVDEWRKDLEVSDERLAYEMGFWNVEGAYAYAVIAGTLTVTIKGQTVVRTGTLAYTFSKHGEEWQIDAQAWGRTS